MTGTVGTAKVYENERMVIWEFVLEPGKRAACHTHQLDYVFYALEGSRLEVFDANDGFLFAFDSNQGDAFAFRCDGGELISTDGRGLRAPATQSARNAGAGRYREMLVETKQ